jgi:hypothetical protein
MEPGSSNPLEIGAVLEDEHNNNLDELLGLEAVGTHPSEDNDEDIQRFLDQLAVSEDAASSDTVPDEQVSPTSFLNRWTGTSISSSPAAGLSPTIARHTNEIESSTIASGTSMSPTTLLDSLLSTHTNFLSQEPDQSIMIHTEAERAAIDSLGKDNPPAPPLSSESVELSSLQELMQAVSSEETKPGTMDSVHSSDDNFFETSRTEVTNTSGDGSFFGSAKDDGSPRFDLTSDATLDNVDVSLFVIGSDDDEEEDDGFNSFMTAIEDASSILSKASTAGTLETTGSIAADVTKEPSNEADVAAPERGIRIDASSAEAAPHVPIQATVSFAQLLEEHVASDPIPVQDIPAPLPLVEDPTTPKRSGRDPLIVSMDNRPPSLGERGGLAQDVPPTVPSPSMGVVPLNPPNESMGETTLLPPVSFSQNLDTERKDDHPYDVVSALRSIAPLPLSSDHNTPGVIAPSDEKIDLSVPLLLDDGDASPSTLMNFESVELDATVVINDEKTIPSEDVNSAIGLNSSPENVDCAPSKITASSHTEELEIDVLDESISPRVLKSEMVHSLGHEKNPSFPMDELDGIVDNQIDLLEFGHLESSAKFCLTHEMKSLLQVEFPSVLESGNKKSDVSLSSASSTISHGSYSKARASSSYVAAPTKTKEMQKRNGNGDSLPPRSPALRNDQNDPTNTSAFAASVSRKLSHTESVRRDDADLERGVESKWIKRSLAINFNPKKSIFAGKLDKEKNSTDSISSPGSPPEPCFESDYDSSNDGSSHSSTVSNDVGNKEASMWDMMADSGIFVEQSATNEHVVSENSNDRSPSLAQAIGHTDDSVTASSIAPSESEVSKINKLSTKPSFKSDASLSSRAMKGRNSNAALSFSQHSRGSLCSGRSRDGRQGSRGSKSFLSPVGKSGQVAKPLPRLELDNASLGRVTLRTATSPNQTTLPTTHCSSPDLFQLNEKPRPSYQPTPIKISIPDSGLSFPDGSDRPLIADALSSDILSPESLVQKYASFENEKEAIRDQDAALLQEEWLSLSAISPIDLPFRYSNSFAPLKFIGSLLWRQLISCWKHAEITRTMLTCAMFSGMDDDMQCSETRGIKRSLTSSQRSRRSSETLELNGVHFRPKSRRPDTRVFKGFDVDRRDYSLSTFLTQISCEQPLPSSGILRHEIASSGSNKVVIDDLLDTAQSSLPELSLFVKDVIAFSSIVNSCKQDAEVVRFSVGIKDTESIIRKAKRKYQGDVLQVKDILRAQILFPTEGGLVCGLIRLIEATKSSNLDNVSSFNGLSLVRVKNLFAAGSFLGTLRPSPLPTGYRHVLLNFRLKCGLLVGRSSALNESSSRFHSPDVLFLLTAELQFNLLHLFNALGQEGYILHRELIDLQNALNKTEKNSKLIDRFDMNELVNDAISCNLLGRNSNSLFFDVGSLESTSTEPLVSPDAMSNGAPESYNEIRNLSEEATTKHLEAVASDAHSNLTGGDIFLAVLEHGSIAASQSPRDVSIFYCLYILLAVVVNRGSEVALSKLGFGVKNVSDVMEYARKCLLRCLAISNEAMSIGMTGWLEYGASSIIDRFSELPFSVLRNLTHVYGRQDKWADAECVCRALLIRCEDHLPAYHPTTLSSLIDLAIVSSIIGNHKFAEKTLSRAAGRLSKYLTEMESIYIKHVTKAKPAGKAGKPVVCIEHGRDACFMLHSFASHLQKQLHRDIASLVDSNHYIILANHCFVADSLAVLANCVASANFFLGAGSGASENHGLQYWQMAYRHYEYAFHGYVKTKNVDDPAVARAAYGVARCLREFGKTEKALQLLALTVSFKDDSVVEPNINKSATRSPSPSKEKINIVSNEHSVPVPRFLPVAASFNSVSDKLKTPKLLSSALCLWLMAVLSIDRSRNEEGREQAFGYLHAASVALQASLSELSHIENDSTKAICIRFLAMIEDEAEQIAEPIYE